MRDIDLYTWLLEKSLVEYYDALVSHDISLDILLSLNENDLSTIGIATLGARKRLIQAINETHAATSRSALPSLSEEALSSLNAYFPEPTTAMMPTTEGELPMDLLHEAFLSDTLALPVAEPTPSADSSDSDSNAFKEALEALMDIDTGRQEFQQMDPVYPDINVNPSIDQLSLMGPSPVASATPEYSIATFPYVVEHLISLGRLRRLKPAVEKRTKQAGTEQTNQILYRSGRWTHEEERYIECLIEEFEAGFLPLTNGTMLRMFLAAVLNCERMRVSKKFAGRGPQKQKTRSMGKHIFKRNQSGINALTDYEIFARRNRLVEAETAFFRRHCETEATIGTGAQPLYVGWHTYDPRTNPLIAYFGEYRSEKGGRIAKRSADDDVPDASDDNPKYPKHLIGDMYHF